uniref:NYN domain-containing protein n=1 Tax=Brassica oleracea TaxID=3712 RepID=A0A3P6CXB7_BRAOL|nr:unnamed protein product [Brassica oleracea]
MIRDSSCIGPGPVNFFVIAKPKRELHRVLHCLKSRRHNVLLVKPPPPDEEFLFSVASLLENARFLGGGKPRFKELYASYALEYDMCFEEYVDIPEDLSKTKLDTHGKLLLETEDMKKPESSECPGRQIDGGSGWGSSEEPYLKKHKAGESYGACVYKVPDITLYMIRHASCIGPGPVNFFVIAKPKRELHRVLHCLQSRRHNVLLVKPPPPDEEFLFSVASLLENVRFLGGGKPRFKELYASYASEYDMCFEEYVDIPEDISKTVDFSERIPTVRGPRTAVFWDAVDCPFPPSSTPDEIYHSISSALVERYFSDNITIWAYLDDDDDDKKGSALLGGDKTWASRIYFLPGGVIISPSLFFSSSLYVYSHLHLLIFIYLIFFFLFPGDKASRRIRMLNDMFLLARDSPQCSSYDASLVLFADQFIGAAYYINMLQRLDDIRYHILLVTPTLDINKPETPQWPGLLLDRGAATTFALETCKISEEPPSPKKHEALAAAEEEETPKKLQMI